MGVILQPPSGADRALAASGMMAAILAEPADDIARLVFADWCDENGQPARAAFIREQVARPDWRVAVLPNGGELRYQGKVLFRTPAGDEDDDAPLAFFRRGAPAISFVFRRGFPDTLAVPSLATDCKDEVRAFPITGILVAGAEPYHRMAARKWPFVWVAVNEGHPPIGYQVPRGLFRELKGGKKEPSARAYQTRDDALAALSEALLERARSGRG